MMKYLVLLVKQVLQFCMAAVVGIVSRYSLIILEHHRNQPYKSKLAYDTFNDSCDFILWQILLVNQGFCL